MRIVDTLLARNCHVCPWWLAYFFDNRLRKLFHDPEKLLEPYVKPGMTVMDIGCGMGWFSLGMARLVGENGCVISVDIQDRLLKLLMKRARSAGLAHRICPCRCEPDRIDIDRSVDFVLMFWMAHEIPHRAEVIQQVCSLLTPAGICLLAEPKRHVSMACFKDTLHDFALAGFTVLGTPAIALSRSALLGKAGRQEPAC